MKLLFIQTGEPVAEAKQEFGDFHQWFFKALNINKNQMDVYRVFEDMIFPTSMDYAGIIISGSPAMITENHSWSKKTKEWLKPYLKIKTPILGVCYGHQLLAKLLGGTVDWNPKGREIGQVSMQLTAESKNDPLLSQFYADKDSAIELFATHLQSVTYLPENVKILGQTNLDSNHCFCYDNHVWGFQFHPEFTANITKTFIQARSENIRSEGLNPERLINDISENHNGEILLQTFRDLCFNKLRTNKL